MLWRGACKSCVRGLLFAARNVRVSYSLIDAARGDLSSFRAQNPIAPRNRPRPKLAKGHTVENGLKEGLEEECKNNFAWDHVIIDGTPGHYRLYSNDHGKFVLDDMFPDWN